MTLTTECPRCGCEDGWFDGDHYECPECNHDWGYVYAEEDEEE
jgi:uncharacterized Zn ribbon protein